MMRKKKKRPVETMPTELKDFAAQYIWEPDLQEITAEEVLWFKRMYEDVRESKKRGTFDPAKTKISHIFYSLKYFRASELRRARIKRTTAIVIGITVCIVTAYIAWMVKTCLS